MSSSTGVFSCRAGTLEIDKLVPQAGDRLGVLAVATAREILVHEIKDRGEGAEVVVLADVEGEAMVHTKEFSHAADRRILKKG